MNVHPQQSTHPSTSQTRESSSSVCGDATFNVFRVHHCMWVYSFWFLGFASEQELTSCQESIFYTQPRQPRRLLRPTRIDSLHGFSSTAHTKVNLILLRELAVLLGFCTLLTRGGDPQHHPQSMPVNCEVLHFTASSTTINYIVIDNKI